MSIPENEIDPNPPATVVDDGDDDIPAAFTFARIDFSRLLDRQLLNVIAGIVVAVAVVAWPARTDRVLARLIGIALILLFSSSALGAWRARPRQWTQIGIALACIAGGGVLLVLPDQSITLIGRLAALLLAIEACRSLISTFRSPSDARSWAWPVAKAIAGLATASLIAAYPSELLGLATAVAALGWALVGIVALSQSLRADEARSWRYSESRDVIIEWLDGRPKDAGDRRALYAKILYEGPGLRLRIIRFVSLMSFASVIASMGVITDSTAVVIGAMLVAPLMTPLMGTAISVVMGWPNRLTRAASVVLLGIAIAILIGMILGEIAPTTINAGTNSQILARSSPTILDLITAVAAGGAGAYGLSRPDVSDALPGVAIAISLVPPLSVVGIAYSQGAWAAGNGALLLFVTNALAIIIVGGATFVITGVTPIRLVAGNQQRVRTATASLVALGALVIGALSINGGEIAANAIEINSIEQTSIDWADAEPGYSFVQAQIDGDRVTVVILGSTEDPPAAEELHQLLVEELGREDIVVDVRLLVQERDTFPVGALDGLPD